MVVTWDLESSLESFRFETPRGKERVRSPRAWWEREKEEPPRKDNEQKARERRRSRRDDDFAFKRRRLFFRFGPSVLWVVGKTKKTGVFSVLVWSFFLSLFLSFFLSFPCTNASFFLYATKRAQA